MFAPELAQCDQETFICRFSAGSRRRPWRRRSWLEVSRRCDETTVRSRGVVELYSTSGSRSAAHGGMRRCSDKRCGPRERVGAIGSGRGGPAYARVRRGLASRLAARASQPFAISRSDCAGPLEAAKHAKAWTRSPAGLRAQRHDRGRPGRARPRGRSRRADRRHHRCRRAPRRRARRGGGQRVELIPLGRCLTRG